MKTLTLTLAFLSLAFATQAQWSPFTVSSVNHTKHTNYSGNVIIGTSSTSTTPLDKLEVIGNVRSNQFNAVNGTFNVPNTTTNLFLKTNGTTRMTVLNTSGNVGIGTTSPGYPLEVNGTLKASSILLGSTTLVSSQWTTSS